MRIPNTIVYAFPSGDIAPTSAPYSNLVAPGLLLGHVPFTIVLVSEFLPIGHNQLFYSFQALNDSTLFE